MTKNNYGLYLAGVITEEAMSQSMNQASPAAPNANQMAPGGSTPMAGNPGSPPLGNATGDDQQENLELDELSNQMQRIMSRLLPLVARMKNKTKGIHVLGVIGNAIQSAFPQISDAMARKAVTGDLPQQKEF